MNIRDLMDKRAQLIAESKSLLALAESQKRTLTADESAQFDRIMDEAAAVAEDINRRTAVLEAESRQFVGVRPEPETNDPAAAQKRAAAAFGKFLRYQTLDAAEQRALAADSDPAGGYIKPPQQFASALLKAIDNQVYMRQWADVMQLTGSDSLGIGTIAADPDDADWTAEVPSNISFDSSMTFGKRELKPVALTKGLKVSQKLLRLSPNVEQIVIDRLAYKFAVSQEKGFLTGNGSGQPLGVFTASVNGISTGRDVATDNTTTAVTFDGLLNAKYAVKGQYQARARWMFHRDGIKQIAKIKNSTTNEYIWRASERVGEPDTLLGAPVFMSEYVPNTFTTGLYVGIYGDFFFYKIAESLNMEVARLNELYAEQRQVGFIATMEVDGMPALEEAFARVKLA